MQTLAKTSLKVTGGTLLGGAAFTTYYYPELRKEPKQLVGAMVRGLRCIKAGTMMASDYIRAGNDICSDTHYKAAGRLFDMFCANGGPYIKLGQMFGQLEALVPPEYIKTFEPMCMRAPTTDFVDVRRIVEEESGCKLEDLFSYFEEKPIASASLGQVHKARLRKTGEIVAVKVQHRWIKENVNGDLQMIQFGVDIAKAIFPDFRYGWLADEFKTRLPRELDFVIEADNAKRCARIFKDKPKVSVPKVYDEYTRPRMLVMSYETGFSVARVKEMHNQGFDLKHLAQLISEVFVHMIFKEGFIHADPHPGNLFVRKTGKGARDIELVILDHGIYTDLPKDTRLSYAKLWRGVLAQDEALVKEASSDLGCDFH